MNERALIEKAHREVREETTSPRPVTLAAIEDLASIGSLADFAKRARDQLHRGDDAHCVVGTRPWATADFAERRAEVEKPEPGPRLGHTERVHVRRLIVLKALTRAAQHPSRLFKRLGEAYVVHCSTKPRDMLASDLSYLGQCGHAHKVSRAKGWALGSGEGALG